MTDRIDLRPLHGNPGATTMLLLARGQLNRAFRTNGLSPPDSLVLRNPSVIDLTELDDPAALGIDHALARFGEAFTNWASGMPLNTARPVLDVLLRTHQALSQQQAETSDTAVAVRTAYEFLLQGSGLGDGSLILPTHSRL